MQKSRKFPPFITLALLVVACGGSLSDEGPKPTGFYQGEAVNRIALPPSSKAPPQTTPPEVFTPQPIPPKYRHTDITPPDLSTLPPLTMRMRQCFNTPKRKQKTAVIAGAGGARQKPSAGSATSRQAQRRQANGKRRPPRINKPAPKPKKADIAESQRVPAPVTAPPQSIEKSRVKDERSYSEPDGALEALPRDSTYDDVVVSSEIGEAEDAEAAPKEMEEPVRQGPIRIATEPLPPPPPKPDPDDQFDDWGDASYLSNDDTMSLSSAQRVIYAIDNFLPLPVDHIRPHELLNYFTFQTAPVAEGHDFSVFGDMAPDPREAGIYNLGLAVKGRPMDLGSRRNAALTLVLDRSGSMADEGRMNYLKQGLSTMLSQLKQGDMIHIVIFDQQVCVPMENFVIGRDDMGKLKRVISALKPRGATDLHKGLKTGYEIADRAFVGPYSNRVLLVTDALTNSGETAGNMISTISKYYDSRKIRLSGIGVGRQFNDALLDRLTERGKGAYVFLGSEAEVDAVFGPRFISLIETSALNVHFRLHLPHSLRLNVFYGEESSTAKADVQEIHYFANTSQLFFSDLMAKGGRPRLEDGLMLSIDYQDPESGQRLVEEYAFTVSELMKQNKNVKKARVIMTFVDLLSELAARPIPSRYRRNAGGWNDADGWTRCNEGEALMNRLSQGVDDDPEIMRVKELFLKYCARYDRPRRPSRRQIAAPDERWPGAVPQQR